MKISIADEIKVMIPTGLRIDIIICTVNKGVMGKWSQGRSVSKAFTIVQSVNPIFLYFFIFKSPFNFLVERTMAVQERTPILPQTKTPVISFRETTNPNVSPIGKRFGLECFGTDVHKGFN